MSTVDVEVFTLHHRNEILEVLDRLLARRALATVEFGDGHAMVSSLLELRRNDGAMLFDLARDPEQNRRLFAASRLIWQTELDNIQIAFETRAPALTAFTDGPAAVVALPTQMTRLQRREWYRVALPGEPPVRCTVLDSDGNASPARALDLSCVGAGLMVDSDAVSLGDPGTPHELILSIPELGRIEIDATLSNLGIQSTDARDAGPQVRAGFRFEGVAPKVEATLQRYVQRVEVDRLRRKK